MIKHDRFYQKQLDINKAVVAIKILFISGTYYLRINF